VVKLVIIATIILVTVVLIYVGKDNSSDVSIKNILKDYLDRVIIEIENEKEIDKVTIKKINRLIRRQKYFEYFNYYVSVVFERIENKIGLCEFIRNMPGLIHRVASNLRSNNIDKRCKSIYTIGLYRYDNEYTTNIIIESLESKYFNIRLNALKSLSLMGSVENVISAILLINRSNRELFSIDIIVNGLREFKGNFVELDETLLFIMDRLSSTLKEAVIIYFSKVGYNAAVEKLYSVVNKGDISKEVEIAIIGYFGKVKCEEVFSYLLNNIKGSDVNIVTSSLKALMIYDVKIKKEELKEIESLLESENNSVRKNAAKLVGKVMNNNGDIVNLVNRIKDNEVAVNDVMESLFENGKISYDEWKDRQLIN